MPRIDDGLTDGPPGRALETALVTLPPYEAYELLESLKEWAESIEQGDFDPGWHTHIGGSGSPELTISIRPEEPGAD